MAGLNQLLKLIIPVALWCPYCGTRHVDETRKGERWGRRAHRTHRCQNCYQDFEVYVSGKPKSDDAFDFGELIKRATSKPAKED